MPELKQQSEAACPQCGRINRARETRAAQLLTSRPRSQFSRRRPLSKYEHGAGNPSGIRWSTRANSAQCVMHIAFSQCLEHTIFITLVRSALRQDESEGNQMSRLNGWQRIGIALSVLWSVLVVGIVITAYYGYAQKAAIELGSTQWPPVTPFLALLVVPLAGGWLVVYLAKWATNWIGGGFKPTRRREDIRPPRPEGRRARKPALHA